jgi:signal transduction histidine kinase
MSRLRHAQVVMLMLALGLAATAHAARVPTRDEVIQRVNQAVEFYKAQGRTKALAELNREDGAFSGGLDYVDVHDLNGVCLAHPHLPDIIGTSRLEVTDMRGRRVIKEIVDAARLQASGWISYELQNPNTGRIEKRLSYWVVHDGLIFKARTNE